MTNIFKHISIERLMQTLSSTAQRMPLSMLFSSLGFVIIAVQVFFDGSLSNAVENILAKGLITLIMMFALSVAVYLFSESVGAGRARVWRNQLLTLIAGLLFYYFFDQDILHNIHAESFVFIALTLVATITSIFVAPFVKHLFRKDSRRALSQREFYIFTYDTLLTIIMAAVVANIVMLLGFLAWWALTTLFDLGYGFNDFYGYWSAFALVLVGPIFFLANLGGTQVNEAQKVEDGAFYALLVKYVGLPAIAIYFVILYAYTLKVLINFSDWPHGEVAWMVIGFSLFGYFVYAATYVFESFAPARTFRTYFPLLVLPQVAMLFYAIGLRINQYDITINRYFVVAFGIWLLLISLHFIFSRGKYLGALPLSLVAMIAIISIGPWSVYRYPEARQLSKLTQSLGKAQMHKESKIVPMVDTQAYSKLSGEVYSSINYLCNNHGCDALRPILAEHMVAAQAKDQTMFIKRKAEEVARLEQEFKDAQTKNHSNAKQKFIIDRLDAERASEYAPMQDWAMATALTKALNVHHYNKLSQGKSGEPQYRTFYTKGAYNDAVVHTSGYNYLLRLESEMPSVHSRFVDSEAELPLYKAVLNIDDEQLEVSRRGKDGKMHMVQSFNLHELFKALVAGTDAPSVAQDDATMSLGTPKVFMPPMSRGEAVDQRALTFILSGQELDAQLVLTTLSLPNPKWVSKSEDDMIQEDLDKEAVMVDIYGGNLYSSGKVLIKEH